VPELRGRGHDLPLLIRILVGIETVGIQEIVVLRLGLHLLSNHVDRVVRHLLHLHLLLLLD